MVGWGSPYLLVATRNPANSPIEVGSVFISHYLPRFGDTSKRWLGMGFLNHQPVSVSDRFDVFNFQYFNFIGQIFVGKVSTHRSFWGEAFLSWRVAICMHLLRENIVMAPMRHSRKMIPMHFL